MLLQFINVKGIIYGITSMSTYILPHFSAVPVLILFASMLAFLGFVCTLCWSLFGAMFKRLLVRYARIINAVMALLLVYCAVALFFD